MDHSLQEPDIGSIKVRQEQTHDERVGRDIAFGIQQTLTCWATDFIDPPVSRFLQNRYGDKDHHVTHKHVWGGEIMGDSAAFFVYLGIKRFFGGAVDAITSGVGRLFDTRFTAMGNKAIRHWAEERQLDKHDPRYLKKLQAYKDFQAENLMDSTIIATSATLGNVAIQRALGNHQALPVILGSKLVGAAATMGVMLGLRAALPTATRTLDEELSGRYFSRLVGATRKLFGVKDAPLPVAATTDVAPFSVSLADAPLMELPLEENKKQAFLRYLKQSFGDGNPARPGAISAFIAGEKQVCDGFIQALYPKGRFADMLAAQHYQALRKLQGALHDEQLLPRELVEKAARVSVESILINRRDDMLARKKLLDDPVFLGELSGVLSANVSPPKVDEEEKEEAVIEALARTKGGGREPAVHIYANAKGQLIEHQALIETFDPKSKAARVLAAELSRHLARDATNIAEYYMQERQAAAKAATQRFLLDSNAVTKAVERSEQKRQRQSTQWHERIKSDGSTLSEYSR